MLRRQTGKFFINKFVVEDDLEFLCKVFSDLEFFPFRTEFLYIENSFEICGVSPYFDVIEEGHKLPEYKLTIHTKEEDGKKVYDYCSIERIE